MYISISSYTYTYRYIHIHINIYIHTSSTATTTTTTHTTGGGVYYTDPLPYHYYRNYFHHHHHYHHHHHAPITHTTGGGGGPWGGGEALETKESQQHQKQAEPHHSPTTTGGGTMTHPQGGGWATLHHIYIYIYIRLYDLFVWTELLHIISAQGIYWSRRQQHGSYHRLSGHQQVIKSFEVRVQEIEFSISWLKLDIKEKSICFQILSFRSLNFLLFSYSFLDLPSDSCITSAEMGGLLSKMPPRQAIQWHPVTIGDRHRNASRNEEKTAQITNNQQAMKQKEQAKKSNNLWKLESSSALLSCSIWGSWTRKVQRVSPDLRSVHFETNSWCLFYID